MNEHFLHFAWKNGLFEKTILKSFRGSSLDILNPGTYNRDSGPDFLNARIVIDETEWAGNVEIHLKSSSWDLHKHNVDHAYDNVILHVVLEHDREVITASGLSLETFVIAVDKTAQDRYESYMNDDSLIVCRNDIMELDPYHVQHWINRLAVARLQRKTREIESILESTNFDWEETLYLLIATRFGLNVNRDPFFQLAKRAPLKLLRKHFDDLTQVEAILFGQAGMLEIGFFEGLSGDDYFTKLSKEYLYLKKLYNLDALNKWDWKFHRMRPANFPTIRISQLANLMISGTGLFSRLKEADSLEGIYENLKSKASEYWKMHYDFGSKSKIRSGETGKTLINSLIINSVLPLVFLYGIRTKQQSYCFRVLEIYDKIKPENNRVTRDWASIGIKASSSLESQGLIEVRENYCKNRKCLYCHIGSKLISLGKEIRPENSHNLGESEL